MDREEARRLAPEIAEGITPRKFPEGFIGSDYGGEPFNIPSGGEVSMYRELEGVYVMTGNDRMFFSNPVYAKFVYYCAKLSISSVRIPEMKLAKKAVKMLEEDIGNILFLIGSKIEEMKADREAEKMLLEETLSYLGLSGYSDIVSKEELW